MPITRHVFEQGLTWPEWLAATGELAAAWAERYATVPDPELVEQFRRLPEARAIACLVTVDGADSLGIVPYLARVVDEAGDAAALDLRIFAVADHPELSTDILVDGRPTTPLIAIFDDHWNPVARWGPRPLGARKLVVTRRGKASAAQLREELTRWYAADAGAATLREILPVLRGEPIEERRAMENLTRYLLHFAEAEDD